MGLFDLFKKKDVMVGGPSTLGPASTYDGTENFEFIVEDVFTITGRGTVVTGRVSRGTVAVGEVVNLKNAGVSTTVTGIEMFRKTLDYAQEGDNAGLLLRGISRDQVSRGEIIYK